MIIINKKLLPAKGHYFAFFGAVAGILPFLVRIAMQFGASPSVVGYIYSSLPFIVMLAKGIFGAVADKFQQKKSVLIGSVVLMTSAFFIIDFIPSFRDSEAIKTVNSSLRCINIAGEKALFWCWSNDKIDTISSDSLVEDNCLLTCQSTTNDLLSHVCRYEEDNCNITKSAHEDYFNLTIPIIINLNSTYNSCSEVNTYEINSKLALELCAGSDSLSCQLLCSHMNRSSALKANTTTEKFNYKIISLWILMGLAYIGMGVGVSVGDTIILDMLDKKQNFGRERLWGAVGWGSLSVTTGLLIDWCSTDKANINFTPGMYILLTFGILDVAIILTMKVVKTERPKRIVNDVGSLFLNPEVAVFTLGVFIVGCLTSVLWTFLLVYLNDLGASQLLIGLTMAVQCFLGEIPFFFISNWFLKKLGHGNSLILVLVFFAIRLTCYSLIDNPWLVLPIELTQGITYSIFFTALATYASLKAHPSIHSTVQGILQGMFEGFGVGVGSVVSGIAYEFFGAKHFFLFTAILSAGFAFLLGLVQFYLVHYRKTKSGNKLIGMNENGHGDNETEMSKMISGNKNLDQNNHNISITNGVSVS